MVAATPPTNALFLPHWFFLENCWGDASVNQAEKKRKNNNYHTVITLSNMICAIEDGFDQYTRHYPTPKVHSKFLQTCKGKQHTTDEKDDKHDKCYRREVSKRSSLHERVEITTRFCNKTPKKDRKLVILHAHCEFRQTQGFNTNNTTGRNRLQKVHPRI